MQKEIKRFCAGKKYSLRLENSINGCVACINANGVYTNSSVVYTNATGAQRICGRKKGFPAKHPCFWGGSLYLLRIFAIRCDPKHCFPPLVRPQANSSALQEGFPMHKSDFPFFPTRLCCPWMHPVLFPWV